MGLWVKNALLCALLCASVSEGRPCDERAGWCQDYVAGRTAFNLGDLEDAKDLLARAAEEHPSDECKVKVDNFPESYRPFYYLTRVHLDLGDCLGVWEPWEQSIAREALPRRKRIRLDDKLQRRCGSCDQDCYERLLARAEEGVASCRRHVESWSDCRGIEGHRRRLSKRCTLAEGQMEQAKRSRDPALAHEATATAAAVIDQLQTLFCHRCDDECDERQVLYTQIERLAEEAQKLGEDPVGAWFVTLIEEIQSLIVKVHELPSHAPLEYLSDLRHRLRAEITLLDDSIRAVRFQELADGVVKIETGGKTGTGIIVHLDERVADILTVTHVVDGGQRIAVYFHSQSEQGFDAELRRIQGGDRNHGLAVIRVKVEGELPPARCLPLDDFEPLPTTPIYILGMPLASGAEWVITTGRVAGWSGSLMSLEVRSFGPGNSGGPVVLAGGRVVGVVAEKGPDAGADKGAKIFVHAVPSPDLRSTLRRWQTESCGYSARANRGEKES